jgi:hypothetical protein
VACIAGRAANLAFVFLLTPDFKVGFDCHSVQSAASMLSLGALQLSETAGAVTLFQMLYHQRRLRDFFGLGNRIWRSRGVIGRLTISWKIRSIGALFLPMSFMSSRVTKTPLCF